jgi:hypothetical protein
MPTKQEIDDWHEECAVDARRPESSIGFWPFEVGGDDLAEIVVTALSRWGSLATSLTPESGEVPVPVAERLPEPGDCDVEGRCWWSTPPACGPHRIRPCWTFDSEIMEGDTHWLPAHAIPLPQAGEVQP